MVALPSPEALLAAARKVAHKPPRLARQTSPYEPLRPAATELIKAGWQLIDILDWLQKPLKLQLVRGTPEWHRYYHALRAFKRDYEVQRRLQPKA